MQFTSQFTRETPRLLCYTPGYPGPEWYSNLTPQPNNQPLPIRDITKSHTRMTEIGWLDIDVPFFEEHFVRDEDDRMVCCTNYLALGMHPLTYEAYILMPCNQDVNPDYNNCDHEICGVQQLLWGGDWDILAKLDGTPPRHRNSVGPVLAIESSGRRIAIANWTSISVWTIDPWRFLEEGKECISRLYRPWQIDQLGFVRLESIPLPSRGVVYKLKFWDNVSLYGITDEGVVCWDLSRKARGEFEIQHLPIEQYSAIWEEDDDVSVAENEN